MSLHQKIFAIGVSAMVFILTIELVKKKYLREEYSILWLVTSSVMFVLVIRYQWLENLTKLIGAALPTTTLFLFSIIFLILLGVQFSIKISRLADQVKNLAQENALLRHEIQRRRSS